MEYEKFEIVEIQRDKIKNAPYNPRKITQKARDKLKKNIKEVGLLAPIIWNEVTGNIVSGHQRISVLDSLTKSKDYSLKVSKVKLSHKEEVEQNIFLNNVESQGYFDMDKLGGILNDEIKIENTGFDLKDVYVMFGKSDVERDADDLIEKSRLLKEAAQRSEDVKESNKERSTDNYYSIIVFKNEKERNLFFSKLGIEDPNCINGDELSEMIFSLDN